MEISRGDLKWTIFVFENSIRFLEKEASKSKQKKKD